MGAVRPPSLAPKALTGSKGEKGVRPEGPERPNLSPFGPRLPPTDFFPEMDPLNLGGLRPKMEGFLKIGGQNRGGRRPILGVFLRGWFFGSGSPCLGRPVRPPVPPSDPLAFRPCSGPCLPPSRGFRGRCLEGSKPSGTGASRGPRPQAPKGARGPKGQEVGRVSAGLGTGGGCVLGWTFAFPLEARVPGALERSAFTLGPFRAPLLALRARLPLGPRRGRGGEGSEGPERPGATIAASANSRPAGS